MKTAMKILVVDDNPVNVDVLRAPLEAAGYEILMAPSGEVALKLAPQTLPDLILLDVMMPGLDGFDTCVQLKEHSELKNIPVIFVTGKTATEDIIKGFQVGGADYINKPFRHEEVLARVTTHLKLRQANRKNEKLVEDLKNALLKMESAKQESLAKSHFLSRMTHELRTPMNAVLGFTQLLQMNSKGHLDDEDLELIDEISRGGNHLMQVIGRVLDFAELDEQELQLQTLPVKLSQVVGESVAAKTADREADRNIEICFNGMEAQNVQANPESLREVVDILLDNAIKYNSKAGRITVECHTTPSGRVQLAVEDEGPGVPEVEKDKVFLPLYRGKDHVDQVDGIGMGLACAEKYARLMNASLRVEAGSSGGSRFILEMDSADPG